MTDPVAAAKLFSDLDSIEDPLGREALGKVDFRQAGMFFPDKEYGSVKEAQQALDSNKRKINGYMENARMTQINGFKTAVSSVIRDDNAVVNMPSIRINAAKSMGAHGLKKQLKENQRNRVKSVSAASYLT